MRISNRNVVSKLVRPAMFAALVLVAVAGRASAVSVPEVDPTSMGSALALLVAGGSLLLGRRRSK